MIDIDALRKLDPGDAIGRLPTGERCYREIAIDDLRDFIAALDELERLRAENRKLVERAAKAMEETIAASRATINDLEFVVSGKTEALDAAEDKLDAVREWAETYSRDFMFSRIRREIAIHILAILDQPKGDECGTE